MHRKRQVAEGRSAAGQLDERDAKGVNVRSSPVSTPHSTVSSTHTGVLLIQNIFMRETADAEQ